MGLLFDSASKVHKNYIFIGRCVVTRNTCNSVRRLNANGSIFGISAVLKEGRRVMGDRTLIISDRILTILAAQMPH